MPTAMIPPPPAPLSEQELDELESWVRLPLACRLLATVRALQQRPRPITTAPQDESLLLWNAADGWQPGEWDAFLSGFRFSEDATVNAKYSLANPPTHWLPMPPDPIQEPHAD